MIFVYNLQGGCSHRREIYNLRLYSFLINNYSHNSCDIILHRTIEIGFVDCLCCWKNDFGIREKKDVDEAWLSFTFHGSSPCNNKRIRRKINRALISTKFMKTFLY